MAEILEGPKEWSMYVRCKHEGCRGRFSVKEEDVKESSCEPPLYFVDCPYCGGTVLLENLPPVATRAAKKEE